MSTLSLPNHLMPLLMHIEPLLIPAELYQLGDTVTVTVHSNEPLIHIKTMTKECSLAFNFVAADEDCPPPTYQIWDQWLAPFTELAELQQKVATDPSLVVCGFPANDGCVDIWHHQGQARAVYCRHSGASEAQRAMLLVALALDYPLEDAVVLARAHARSYQDHNQRAQGDLIWPTEAKVFPRALTINYHQIKQLGWLTDDQEVAPFAALGSSKLGLYPVLESADWVERVLQLGVKTTQLRIKNPQVSDLEHQIQQTIVAGELAQAQVFINDYWPLAIKHHAYGVHLGQEDLDSANLVTIQQAGLRLGISTHGYYEILRALEYQPSYIALGHVFATSTKDMPSLPQGVSRLALYQKLIGDRVPTVAIGGITIERAAKVWRTGVSGVAVVSAITQATDPALAITELHKILVPNVETMAAGGRDDKHYAL
ncbi:thiamine phosphate synthase [Photobacterium iliopiscarium]|uniref:Thiamine-phosphate synthase n=1 Tax=Photobacterium iliopiscarium TaxID=56192 RepID=A0A2T3MFZ3_9GAMM|nr:thiamine phosphate synthase [Photobacterium iliopiscarium]PSV92883.1 thiamine phosphate synthase [Photobacterium iliopiscarium]